jgi:hypothetical protein
LYHTFVKAVVKQGLQVQPDQLEQQDLKVQVVM